MKFSAAESAAAIIGLAALFPSALGAPSGAESTDVIVSHPNDVNIQDDHETYLERLERYSVLPFVRRRNEFWTFYYNMMARVDDPDALCKGIKKHLNNNASCASKSKYNCQIEKDPLGGPSLIYISFETIVSCRCGSVDTAWYLAGGNEAAGPVHCYEYDNEFGGGHPEDQAVSGHEQLEQ